MEIDCGSATEGLLLGNVEVKAEFSQESPFFTVSDNFLYQLDTQGFRGVNHLSLTGTPACTPGTCHSPRRALALQLSVASLVPSSALGTG